MAKKNNISEAFLRERLKDPDYRKFYQEEKFLGTLGAEIVKIRKQKRLSQEDLAEKSGLPLKAIHRLEKGEYRKLTLKLLQQIALAVNSRIHVQFVPLD